MSNERFGAKNPFGLYVPMTEDEQEVISRLVTSDDIELVVHGWGIVHQPRITFGDARVQVRFNILFSKPETIQPLHYLDLELRTRAGMPLFKQRYPTLVAGTEPLMVGAGIFVEFAWDIAIHSMDPAVVRMVKPGATGLTSRRLDTTTGERTLEGNLRPDAAELQTLRILDRHERQFKAKDRAEVIKATLDAGQEVISHADGTVEAPSD